MKTKTTVLGAGFLASAIGLASASSLSDSELVYALLGAILAGVFLAFWVGTKARRVLGLCIGALGMLLLWHAWPIWWLLVIAAVIIYSGLATVMFAPVWVSRTPAYERETIDTSHPHYLWLAMDAGKDPTNDQFSDNLDSKTSTERASNE